LADGEQKLKERIAELEKQNLYLRADFENFKRNAFKERRELTNQGQDQVLGEIFNILELIERAIDSGRQHSINDSVIEGLELTRKEIYRLLEKFNVEKIPSEGAAFNPKFHEAISVVDADDLAPGTVFSEQKPGFVREGRVLQPSKVVVVKDRQEPGSEPN
jgi:molecular chaperone GrpE